jgi:hypothetical protein
MRPFSIEFIQKIIEAGLLSQTVQAGRARGLLLQSAVDAFVPPILVRFSGFDALDRDA